MTPTGGAPRRVTGGPTIRTVVDRLERLTDLIALLLHTHEPLTLEQIRDRMSQGSTGYERGESGRRAFERDKATLRDEGIEITVEYPEGEGGAAAYRIRAEDYELTDLDLTDEEQVALNLALSAVRLEGTTWTRRAGWKLGDPEVEPVRVPFAALPGVDLLPDLADAVGAGARVAFTYRGEPKQLDLWALLQREGFWYVSGQYPDSADHRFFRVDRIEPNTLTTVGDRGADPPDGYDPASLLPSDPKLIGTGAPVTASVAVDPAHAPRVAAELGHPQPLGTTADGWPILPVPVINRPAFRSWLLGFLGHARIEAPADLRAEVVAWLEGLAGAGA